MFDKEEPEKKKSENDLYSFFEKKQIYFNSHNRIKDRKKWYYSNYVYYRYRMRTKKRIKFLLSLKLPKFLSFLRWIYIDLLRGKEKKFFGIYQFVGLPGEGKTIAMVAHIERVRELYPDIIIATNFNYKYEQYKIKSWIDIVEIACNARNEGHYCIIAVDEIQNSFDASEWRNFPSTLHALLTYNRKMHLQFLCSAQIYDRIPSKIKKIANYTVICKNKWGADRYFINYYFEKSDYEATFDGKRKSAEFVRDFIADDELYSLYDTYESVRTISANAKDEADRKLEAFHLLFGNDESEENEEPD